MIQEITEILIHPHLYNINTTKIHNLLIKLLAKINNKKLHLVL